MNEYTEAFGLLGLAVLSLGLVAWTLAPLYRPDAWRCPECGRVHRADRPEGRRAERAWIIGVRPCPRCRAAAPRTLEPATRA
jgi:hypothetical protein